MKSQERPFEYPFTRRNFLRGTAALGAMGVAGTRLPIRKPLSRNARQHASSMPQPGETGWRAKQPPLSTPWTHQVAPENCLPEYPRPQMRRQRWSNLNGVWQFEASDTGGKPPIGRELKERILVPFPVESAISGIMRHHGRMFYRRRFIVPRSWNIKAGNPASHHQRLLLHFDAVDFEAHVWVNGTLLGVHKGGYDRFSFDITDALRTNHANGPEAEQELVILVYDPTERGTQPLGKQRVSSIGNPRSALWYTPTSGIWQTVWLEPVPDAYIDHIEMTPHLAEQSLGLVVHAVNAHHHVIEVAAYDGGRPVASATGEPNQDITLRIPKPKLWSPDSPFLYDLTVRLADRNAPGVRDEGGAEATHDKRKMIHPHVDEIRSYFGMRSIEILSVRGKPHITLNGQFIFQLSNLQQGYWPDGIYTAATDEGLKFDLQQAKQLGFNTVRKHQKIEPDRWYYHADRLGLLVWQDMPATALGHQRLTANKPVPYPGSPKHREYEIELRRIITQQHNHPSIVMWIPFNEGWGEFDTSYIANLVKKWDPSRLVDQMSGFNVCGCGLGSGDVIDRHNLRGVSAGPPPLPRGHEAAIIGEFGAYGYSVPDHTWDPKHSHPRLKVSGAEALTRDYVAAMRQIREFAVKSGLSGANYNLFADVEHQVNGLYTYDRRVFKADKSRVRDANLAVIASAAELLR